MTSTEATPLRAALDNLVAKWRQDERRYSATQLEQVLAQFPSSLGVESGQVASPLREALDDLMAIWQRQQRPDPATQLRGVLNQFTKPATAAASVLPEDLVAQLSEFMAIAQDFRRQAESVITSIDEGGYAGEEPLSVKFDRSLEQVQRSLDSTTAPSDTSRSSSRPRC